MKNKKKIYKSKKPKIYKSEEPKIYKKMVYKSNKSKSTTRKRIEKNIDISKNFGEEKEKINYQDHIDRINEILANRDFGGQGLEFDSVDDEVRYLKEQRAFYREKQKEQRGYKSEIKNNFKLR